MQKDPQIAGTAAGPPLPDHFLSREPRIRMPARVADQLVVECADLARGAVRLVDVSRNGLRLTGAGDPRPDERVTLRLPGAEGGEARVEAVVRWWRVHGQGRGEGGFRVDPESMPAWHAVLQAHVVPQLAPAAALVPPGPVDERPQIVLAGTDPAETARLAARLSGAGLGAQLLEVGSGGATAPLADIVVAGPFRGGVGAPARLAALLGMPGLGSALVLLLVPGADTRTCRALLEAGAFDCVNERDAGEALDLRLLVAVRLCQQRRRARAAADRLLDLSGRDPLTGLANRRQFLALAAEERRRADELGEPLSLMLIDLDHFKDVNDLYGHPAGDAALRALARLLRRHLRPFDIVGRYGGEEFIALISGANQTGALTAAERIRSLIAATPFDSQGIIRLTASIGVVSTEAPHTVPFAELLASADRALYRAKHSGRNQVRPGVIAAGSGLARPAEEVEGA